MKSENGKIVALVRGDDYARSVVEGLRREMTLWKIADESEPVDYVAAVGSRAPSDPAGMNPLFINKSDAKNFGLGNNRVFRIPMSNLVGGLPFPHKELWFPVAKG